MRISTDFSHCLTAREIFSVPFHDLDPAGVAWHGRYFKYMESARAILMNDLNYSYQSMVDSGYMWPVVDATLRYLRPLVIDRKYEITACLREWEIRLVLDYKIEDKDGILHTTGRTIQIPIDAVTKTVSFGSPQRLIDNVQRKMDEFRTDGHAE